MNINIIDEMKDRDFTIEQCENFFKECEALGFSEEEYFVYKFGKEHPYWQYLKNLLGIKEEDLNDHQN